MGFLEYNLVSQDGSTSYTIYPENNNFAFQIANIEEEYPGLVDPVLHISKSGNVTDKLSAADLVIIVRHILQLVTLENPDLVIAADTNGDGTISAIDLVTLQKVILGIENNFPNDESYRIFPSEIPLTLLPGEVQNLQITAIKTGDLNGF